MNYNEDIQIDPLALDEECLKHPVLYMQYGLLLQKAKDAEALIKEKLDHAQNEIRLEVIRDPASFEVVRPTAPIIDALISVDGLVVELKELLEPITREIGMYTVVLKGFDRRTKSLDNLVALHNSEYFSTPKPSTHIKGGKRNLGKNAAMLEDSQRSSLKESIVKKKRKKTRALD